MELQGQQECFPVTELREENTHYFFKGRTGPLSQNALGPGRSLRLTGMGGEPQGSRCSPCPCIPGGAGRAPGPGSRAHSPGLAAGVLGWPGQLRVFVSRRPGLPDAGPSPPGSEWAAGAWEGSDPHGRHEFPTLPFSLGPVPSGRLSRLWASLGLRQHVYVSQLITSFTVSPNPSAP